MGDLWKYDTTLHQWALMAGVNGSTPGNYTNDQYAFPASRSNSIGWYEYISSTEEYLWLFGGNTASGTVTNPFAAHGFYSRSQ
jgi:hypothetical protein